MKIALFLFFYLIFISIFMGWMKLLEDDFMKFYSD